MKRIVLTVVFALLCVGLFGQKWQRIGNGSLIFPKGAPAKLDIKKMLALNQTTIFAYGPQTFILSSDAGATWDSIPINFKFIINHLHFFDQSNGIAVGDSGNYDAPLMLKTYDGGKTWIKTTVPNSINSNDIRSISFKDSNDFIVGESLSITKDGGKTYNHIFFAQGTTTGPINGGLNYFGDSSIFYYDYSDNDVYFSENLGKNWTQTLFQIAGDDVDMYNVYFAPGNKLGFLMGGFYGVTGVRMYMTKNGGKTWQYPGGSLSFTKNTEQDFSFIDSANGWFAETNNKIYRFQGSGFILDTAGLGPVFNNSFYPRLAMATPTLGYMIHYDNQYVIYRYGNVSQGSSLISGKVYVDMDTNNQFDSLTDIPLANTTVIAQPGNYYTTTDGDGNYSFHLDIGNYTLSFIKPTAYSDIMQYSNPASGSMIVNVYSGGQTITGKDFSVKPVNLNSILTVSLTSSARRLCFRNATVINYQNIGFKPTNNVTIALVYPAHISIVNADKSYTVDAQGRYVFTIGTMGGFESGRITITDSVSCDTRYLGRTACTEVYIYGDSVNYKTDTSAWDQSEVIVKARCLNGWINFQVINTTAHPMGDSAELRFFSNATLKDKKKYKLGANDTLNFTIHADYTTWRMEADQRPGHPLSQYAQATIEGCEGEGTGNVSTGFVNRLPVNDFKYKKYVSCEMIRGSYDPNDKTVYPEGLTASNYVKSGTPLTYRIRFQNTGTDTAFKVVVKDTLSPDIDLASFRLTGASHLQTHIITGKGRPVLEVIFNNINLPDSTADKAASSGFFTYTVQHKGGIAQGTKIDNTAHIYFDFNSAIVTNTASVTIKDTAFVDIDPIAPVTEFPFILKGYNKDTLCVGDTFKLAIIGEGPYNWFEISNPAVSLGTGFELEQTAQTSMVYVGQTVDGYDTLEVLVKNCANGTNSINETGNANITIYPNPSMNGMFYIEMPGTLADYTLKITDLTGKQAGTIRNNCIDLTGAKPGIYILIVTAPDNTTSYQKLVNE